METEEHECTTFSFDRVFLPDAIQNELFDYVGRPIIDDILTGYNGTVFAYGQTGSGKTYTMMGRDIYDETDRGIIPRAASLVFDAAANSETEAEFTMKCSMIEIYKETIIDLLDGEKTNLKIKEDRNRGVYVADLTEEYVICEEEMLDVIALGEENRTVASTKMNQVSSRSHSVFRLEVMQKLANGSEKRGILNLVDLAGSEKIKHSGVTGQNLEEA